MSVKVLRLRYSGKCVACGRALAKGTQAAWDDSTRTITCDTCRNGSPPADPFAGPNISESEAGTSAQRMYERRHSNFERQVREQHPIIGGMLLATASDQSVEAWSKGAKGERSLGARLDRLSNVWVLHDRLIPGTKANIDHLVVAPTGVWVVDAKRYKGRIERRSDGPFGLGSSRLFVGTRDRTKLIGGVQGQVEVVRRLVPDETPVRGALCFVDGDWSLFSAPFTIGGVAVHWPKSLGKALEVDGPLARPARGQLAERLDQHFRPAAHT
ncbi:MAG: nuclease-related domain-containing protein [Acidimicrobiia bacterium]|nr:nuclease-related domain-containing protein [Acidimicrobiia bacterium]